MADFSLAGKHVNVAMMTSGGLAPCLSSSISLLSKYWIEAYRAGTISGLTLRFYNAGYKGVLIGDSFVVPESDWNTLECLNFLGGSPIGNSRVKVRFPPFPYFSIMYIYFWGPFGLLSSFLDRWMDTDPRNIARFYFIFLSMLQNPQGSVSIFLIWGVTMEMKKSRKYLSFAFCF